MTMEEEHAVQESNIAYETDLQRPVIVEDKGKPVAVLLSVEEYRQYQSLRQKQAYLTATAAQRAADRAVFRDLVGLALASEEPVWSPQPRPQWRVPYRLIDGPLLIFVTVDAQTGQVNLTDEEREQLLRRVARLMDDVSTT